MKTGKLNNYFTLVRKMILYNLRIIFINKFIWFLAGSVVFYLSYLSYMFQMMFQRCRLYGVFLFGILLVFYPSVSVYEY
jgi:hypothetical protein